MANWCSNIVEFKGEPTQLTELQTLFEALALKERKERKGQLPHFIKVEQGFLFESRWEGGMLFYETKWSPNIAVIEQVADHFAVGFVHDYFEPGNQVYGQAVYENGMLTDTCLEDDDFDQIAFDEQADTYTFEGKVVESDTEVFEILLERKKAINALQQ